MIERIQNRTMTVVLLPAGQLEVMMKRRHGEESLAGEFEAQHLQND